METTATKWLLDTSILVDLLRGHQPARHWIDSIPGPDRFVSVATVAELIAGCHNSAEQRVVERETALYEILWLGERASQSALEFYKRFYLSHGVGFLDCLIAATALVDGCRVATLNLRHFGPFPGLQAERPY
ncbi:MAG: type II toxin-antitoxin system VapC family toxin [Planctomycetes bacterium]|nr:type II toxin-antitoxin system VapC family toxin [Planctomycetota bacterium]